MTTTTTDERPQTEPGTAEQQPVTAAAAPTPPTDPAQVPDLPAATSEGHLAFRVGQDRLTPAQRAAIAAIVNFPLDLTDPDVMANVDVFMHLCVARGLDPYAKESYLIRRGQGRDTTYTMQVGIDGYRKMARRTQRFIRRVGWYWTGAADADNPVNSPWWRWNPDEGAYERAWVKVWLGTGYPAAARCVIEHFTEDGAVARTEAVANWAFYAPEYQAWHWGEQRGVKVFEFNPDGTKKMVVAEMWARGGPHMLAKCAEAQALRAAFPAEMSGVYTHEEMHRADMLEQERLAQTAATQRREAFEAAQRKREAPAAEAPTGGGVIKGEVVPEEADTATVEESAPLLPVGEAVQKVADTLAAQGPADAAPSDVPPPIPGPVTDEQRRGWLLAELTAQARVLGKTLNALVVRQMAQHRKNPEDWTAEQLLGAVALFRAPAADVIEATNPDAAAAYRDVAATQVVSDLAYVGLVPAQ